MRSAELRCPPNARADVSLTASPPLPLSPVSFFFPFANIQVNFLRDVVAPLVDAEEGEAGDASEAAGVGGSEEAAADGDAAGADGTSSCEKLPPRPSVCRLRESLLGIRTDIHGTHALSLS